MNTYTERMTKEERETHNRIMRWQDDFELYEWEPILKASHTEIEMNKLVAKMEIL